MKREDWTKQLCQMRPSLDGSEEGLDWSTANSDSSRQVWAARQTPGKGKPESSRPERESRAGSRAEGEQAAWKDNGQEEGSKGTHRIGVHRRQRVSGLADGWDRLYSLRTVTCLTMKLVNRPAVTSPATVFYKSG